MGNFAKQEIKLLVKKKFMDLRYLLSIKNAGILTFTLVQL